MNRFVFAPEHDMFRGAARKWFQNEFAPRSERWCEQGYVDAEMYRYGDSGFQLPLHSRRVGSYLCELASEEQKQRHLRGCIRGETVSHVAID